jgi:ubiquinone/menaquinone biosynthesis C-methylase UbiE
MPSYKSIQKTVIEGFSSKNIQKEYKEMARRGLWKSEEKLFKKYFKKRSKILDIGCGSGRTTFALAQMGCKVIGIDITPAMIKSAKELSKELKVNVTFEVGDATNLKFKDEDFDNALFSFNGWNQIPGERNRSKALKEAHRVIKPGGYFIFTSHTRDFGRYTFFWIKQWIKFYILRPLGVKIKEIEYGDRMFKKSFTTEYENEQYLHVPKLSKVKKRIEDAGFQLIFYDKRNNIARQDKKLKSGNCNFFVCKKQRSIRF